MTDIDRSFDWHDAALKGERGPIDANDPKAGFYRNQRKDKTAEAAAFWYDSNDGALRCQINGRDIDHDRAVEIWPYASKRPISADTYWHFIEHGTWPDEHVSLKRQDAALRAHAGATLNWSHPKEFGENGHATPVGDRPIPRGYIPPDGYEVVRQFERDGHQMAEIKPTRTHNLPPEVSPLETYRKDIDILLAGVSDYAAINDDVMSAKAQSLRSKLTEIAGKADRDRKALVQPHIDAQRQVNGEWNPLVESAKGGANAIRSQLERWEDAKREIARKAAEKAASELDAEPSFLRDAPVNPTPAPSAQIRGGSGRAAHVGTKNLVTIVDQDAVYRHFRMAPALIEVLQVLAKAAVDANIDVPGITVEKKSAIK